MVSMERELELRLISSVAELLFLRRNDEMWLVRSFNNFGDLKQLHASGGKR